MVGRHFNLPIKSTFSQTKIGEITKDLDAKRKELEQELETFQPTIPITDCDKSLYI